MSGNIIGTNNFGGGETTIERVTASSKAVLERCDGFKCDDGSLKPDGLVDTLTGTPLTGTTAEQVPIAYVDDTTTKIVARDSTKALRVHASTAWASAQGVVDIIAESAPAKIGKQIIFPTKGPHAELMVFEPEVTSGDNLRPLSLKAPTDYVDGAKPTVTPSATAYTQLFDCDDGVNPWAGESAPYTVDNTATAKSVFTFGDTSVASELAFTKSLGAGVDPTGKSYLLLDIAINNDTQLYTAQGVFANNPDQLPSGYEVILYSDEACTTELVTLPIPRLDTPGRVYRVACHIGSMSTLIRGIGIKTAPFFVTPETGKSYSLTLYSDAAWRSDWTHKGNFLMPAVKFTKAPVAAELTKLTSAGVGSDLPSNANLVTNGDFETTVSTEWTFANGHVSQESNGSGPFESHTGSKCVVVQTVFGGPEVRLIQENIPVLPSEQHVFEVWMRKFTTLYQVFNATIECRSVTDTLLATFTFPATGYHTVTSNFSLFRGTFTAPANTAKATLNIYLPAHEKRLIIDDISIVVNSTASTKGNSVVIMSQAEDGSDIQPPRSKVEYSYAYCAKDTRASDIYSLMISNPSNAQAPSAIGYTVADPWSIYEVSASALAGRIATAAVDTAGSGYAVNDTVSVDGVVDSIVKVLTITGGGATGGVATVEIIKSGRGLAADDSDAATTAITGAGSGCKLNITVANADDEYGDYMQYILIYRRIYDGAKNIWSDWKYAGNVAWSGSSAMVFTDYGLDVDAVVDKINISETREINNTLASSARYVTVAKDRVYCAGLDWDNSTSKWLRPAAIQVSSYKKPWAYPSIVTDATLATDGTELDGYTLSGSLVRGMALLNEDVLVLLDTEFFHLRGEDPISGWHFIGRQSVGCKSNKSVAVGRSFAIWHDGSNFVLYSGGAVEPIGRFLIDASLIDWTKAHSAVFYKDQYIFHCYYNSEWALLIYDTRSDAWRIRRSDALNFVGICTDNEKVYGLTATGYMADVLGGTADDGAAAVVREVWTRYINVSVPGFDAQVNGLMLDITCSTAVDIAYTVRYLGAKSGSLSETFQVDTTKTRQVIGLDVQAEFIKLELSYTGTTPPTINFIGFDVDGIPAE